ncbi:MAG: hypothetical protein AAGJ31_03795 [Verrucomicrobiota bacterium]
MKTETNDYFITYDEWRDAIVNRGRIPLTPEYCAERVRSLQDLADPSTKQFVKLYGRDYRDKVIGWFQRAGEGN